VSVERLGDFEIVREIDRGGMGVVYEARQTSLDRRVALKVLPEELTADVTALRRFEREAKALAALNHPNIVTVYDIGESDGVYFISMEFVDGQPLNKLIPRDGLPLERLLDLAVPLADALSAAHERGITHRDLKPANVVVGKDGRPKILDFGLAKLRREPATGSAEDEQTRTLTMTREGALIGTVPYMSPEQVEGRPVDQRSDLFSLGVTFYEMATGHRPFRGDTGAAVISSILRESPPSVSELRVDLPPDLGRIIGHCLRKDPEHRYQTAKGLRNELEELRTMSGAWQTSGAAPRPRGTRSNRRRLAGWLLGAVAVVVLAVVGAKMLFPAAAPPLVRSVEARRLFEQGQRYEQRGYTRTALDFAANSYRDALRHEPDNALILARLADVLAKTQLIQPEPGRVEEIRALSERALAGDAELPAALIASGRLQLLEGDPAAAEAAARRALRQDPQDHEAHIVLGEALIRSDRTEQGMAELRRGIEVGEGHIWARSALAHALMELGEFDAAAAEYRKVLDYAPDFPSALNNLGTIYNRTGRHLEAVPIYKRLLQIQPDADAASNLGTAYFFLDRMPEAIEAYRTAAELAPGHPRIQRNLGEAYEKSRDEGAAREAFAACVENAERATAAGGAGTDVLVDHAFCLTKLGRTAEAVVVLEPALQTAPGDLEVLYGLAMVHALRGDREQAFDFLRRTVQAGYPPEYIRVDPAFASLENDPRFLEILTSSEP